MDSEQKPIIKIVTFRIDRVNLSKIPVSQVPRGMTFMEYHRRQQIAEKQAAPVIDMPDLRDEV